MNAVRIAASLAVVAVTAACGQGTEAQNTGAPPSAERPSNALAVAKRVGPGITSATQKQAMSHAAPQSGSFAVVERPGGVAVLGDGSVLVVAAPATGPVVHRLSSDGQLVAEAPLPAGSGEEWDGARIEAWGSRGYVLARSGRMALVFVEGEQIAVEQANADFTDLVGATVTDAIDVATGSARSLTLGTPTFGDIALRPSAADQDFVDLYASGATDAAGENGAVPFVAHFRIDYAAGEASPSRIAAVGAAVGGPMAIPVAEIASANTFGIAALLAADPAQDLVLAALPSSTNGSALVVIPAADAEGAAAAPYPLAMSEDGQPFAVTATGMGGGERGVVIPVSSGAPSSCGEAFSGVVAIAPPVEGALSISCQEVAFAGPTQDAAFDVSSQQLYFTLEDVDEVARVELAMPVAEGDVTTPSPQIPYAPDFLNP